MRSVCVSSVNKGNILAYLVRLLKVYFGSGVGSECLMIIIQALLALMRSIVQAGVALLRHKSLLLLGSNLLRNEKNLATATFQFLYENSRALSSHSLQISQENGGDCQRRLVVPKLKC